MRIPQIWGFYDLNLIQFAYIYVWRDHITYYFYIADTIVYNVVFNF